MSKQPEPIVVRVLVGQRKFCGRCMNPFGIVQNGYPIEVGKPGQRATVRGRALCSGFDEGLHGAYEYRTIEPESSYE